MKRLLAIGFLLLWGVAFGGDRPSPNDPKLFCNMKIKLKLQRLDNTASKRQVIHDYALNAIFSSATYLPQEKGVGAYSLPGDWKRTQSIPGDSGLFIAVFENAPSKQVVVAYRGTVWSEWGNVVQDLTPIAPQNASALKITKAVIAQHQGWSVTLTGHSLGGALALWVSDHVPVPATAVVFNASPNFSKTGHHLGGKRVLFREKHEPLALFRLDPKMRTDWDLDFDILVDFYPGFFETLGKHSIDRMAMGLLHLIADGEAGSGDTTEAKNILASVCGTAPIAPPQ